MASSQEQSDVEPDKEPKVSLPPEILFMIAENIASQNWNTKEGEINDALRARLVDSKSSVFFATPVMDTH
jgi:hypothetical protein